MKARLTWTDPTTRVDGSPLLASQILQIGIQLRSTGDVIGFVAPGVQEFTTGELTPGTTVEWAVTVEGTAEIGGKKSFPAFVGIAVPATPPPPSDADLSPVSNLTATLVP